MNFDELLELLRNPGEDGVPEDITDQLAAAHSEALSAADAKVDALTGEISGLQASVSELKSHNYDLMRSIPSNDDAPIIGDGDTDGVDDFDELFE